MGGEQIGSEQINGDVFMTNETTQNRGHAVLDLAMHPMMRTTVRSAEDPIVRP